MSESPLENLSDEPIETLQTELEKVQRAIQVLRDYEYDIVLTMVTKMEAKKSTLPDGTVIEKHRAITRRWDGPGLVRAVARTAAEQAIRGKITGEPLPDNVAEVVGAIAQEINATLQISYGRIGALSDVGIDADEYAEKSPGRWSIKKVHIPQTDISPKAS